MMSVLEINNLYVRYGQDTDINAVHNVSLRLDSGECIGIIGESGSGKTTLAMSIMGLLENRAQISGSICFEGTELIPLSEQERDSYRWKRIAVAFQNSLDVLNPVISIGDQIGECLIRHLEMEKKEARARTENLIRMVGLDPSLTAAYPHQLSGGMRQRILIAMALSCDPDVLIVDEPTTSLDSVSKQEMVRLLLDLQQEKGFAMLVISHELPVIAAMTSRILVMYTGNVVEQGGTKDILHDPRHPYTRGLIYSSPSIHPYRDMWGIPGEIQITHEQQCPFYSRCNQRIEECLREHPVLEEVGEQRQVACLRGGIVTLLAGSGIEKAYHTKNRRVKACLDCNIEIKAGEVAALIGESGSGKTTLAGILSGIMDADSGEVYFEGRKVTGNSETAKPEGIQMVFQDPVSATNEHLTVREIVQEPLDILKKDERAERLQAVRTALGQVQLPYDDVFLRRRGHTLSGGQRQRVAIARALVMNPKLMIADEISSMLDPSNAANLLRLLKGLQNIRGFSMLYITHDIFLTRKIADKVYVMRQGRIIEQGAASKVFDHPQEEYTRLLLGSATV
ncbi:ABC transporter ATP-binding protein [Desulfitobacterium hafniense]|uniref:Nickel import system ATP-binding protein NikD n=1 Tax=Desulfitobacterium hafniense TaxID=49338 RepID=A0A0W1JKH1_DESHA|nr:ABC transporter ATP-binding protein [Desulfitobacterium hafniense]KTE92204.1 ABC transporter ATP-binding protein [Desulfitobacterium hafniense]